MKSGNERFAHRLDMLAFLELAFIHVLLLFRLVGFNKRIRLDEYSLALAFATLFIISAVSLVLIALKKDPLPFAFTVYTLLCILMCIDSLYYSYRSRLPSLTELKMASMLTDVSSTIVDLITPFHLVLLTELSLWLLYAVNCRDKLKRFISERIGDIALVIRRSTIILEALFAVAGALFILWSMLFGGFKTAYLKNEIITYHISDAVSLMIPEPGMESVDITDYISPLAESDREYFGVAEKKNVITIQVEAMQDFVIGLEYNGQEVTPYLNKLLKTDTLHFDNYYYVVGGGNTADAEFSVNNSLYAPESQAAYILYEDNNYYGLPFILKDNGYSGAYAFHGYKGDYWNRENAYVGQGFDDFISEEDLSVNEATGLGITDEDFLRQVLDEMVGYEQPFYSFIITLSSHHPYVIGDEFRMLELLPEHEDSLFGDYLQSIRYVDHCLGIFIEGLKDKGLYENSVISIYGDHFGLPDYDHKSFVFMSELLGREYYANDIFRVPLIIHTPGLGEGKTVSVTGSHIDYLPTILHILGLENRKSVMFGQNLLTASSGIVYEEMHMARGSFINDDIIYSIPMSEILLHIKAFDKKTGERIDTFGYEDIIANAKKEYSDCMAILDADAVVFEE